jgi:hypothetical protein
MLSKTRRVFPDVDGDIEDFARNDAKQFSLGALNLIMQAPQNVARRARMIVLHELDIDARGRCEGPAIEAFKEKSSVVTENSSSKRKRYWP